MLKPVPGDEDGGDVESGKISGVEMDERSRKKIEKKGINEG